MSAFPVPLLRRKSPAEVESEVRHGRRRPFDDETLRAARAIVEEVREEGEAALLRHARRLGDLGDGDRAPYLLGPEALRAAFAALPEEERQVLARTAERIRHFAAAQRQALAAPEVALPGGAAGHELLPVERAGCYAPGGRFPLPSSVLMTAVPARVAGVREVYVASPRPAPVTLAAAHVAGADGLLRIGGAQAIAALAHGAGPLPACDVVVGPGNRFVTAAKLCVAGQAGIDMLAGPSELLVLADGSAAPDLVAADLLAQAEHDPDALPVLVTLDEELLARVEQELAAQLAALPTATAKIARSALAGGYAVVARDLEEAAAVANLIAPEHLELMVRPEDIEIEALRARLRHAGALFLGSGAAEVLGDYGAGPNHVLPTGGTARFAAGLSVFTFLRVRTWLRVDDPAAAAQLCDDAARLARLEGLEAHARAAEKRRPR